MTEHDQQAERLEREVDDMAEHSERLGEEIAGVKKDWEAKQADGRIPGATGEPASARELPPPEPDETD